MKKSDVFLYAIGAILGCLAGLAYLWKSVGITHWLSYGNVLVASFLGAILLHRIVFVIAQIRSSTRQRRRFVWGLLTAFILALPLLIIGCAVAQFLSFLPVLSLEIVLILLTDEERQSPSLSASIISIFVWGMLAFLFVLFLGWVNIDCGDIMRFISMGVLAGAIFSITFDFFFG